ncbi:tripartite tricarboxylate transporter TctB family protein [Polynucleobacter sp. AP-Titi-500A-B4]|uniref:tripartite tricarboxylate transporter TctB family protein n=1 Tax=Polynucleobacter sp. AP-Titi-500A-B4 TaxID=2576923 RepID=UPI001BFDB60E|nr:tripartite tricarboxylate transporter TctB family protein [Polynucleobacter sp. AP-Titi-500A-B4]QWE12162.1 tripartite tricarboxylate transporter TctB family protein [Polynucleobacter sp. AP-Titi-500A-B4]
MKIRNQRDFGAGVMYMVIGLFFTIVATNYPMGTAAKMGPGYFPFCLGILMTALGLLVLLQSLSAKAAIEAIPKFNWRIIAQITGSVVLYGLLLPRMGFLIAVVVLVLVSASASKEFTWKGSLINASFLVAFTYSVFVMGLKLQFPLLPVFLQQ